MLLSQGVAYDGTAYAAYDSTAYAALMAERDSDPGVMLADKGYGSDAIRQDLRDRGVAAEIPHQAAARHSERWTGGFTLCVHASSAVSVISKSSGGLPTRYDKIATSFLAFVLLGAIRRWIRFVHRA